MTSVETSEELADQPTYQARVRVAYDHSVGPAEERRAERHRDFEKNLKRKWLSRALRSRPVLARCGGQPTLRRNLSNFYANISHRRGHCNFHSWRLKSCSYRQHRRYLPLPSPCGRLRTYGKYQQFQSPSATLQTKQMNVPPSLYQ